MEPNGFTAVMGIWGRFRRPQIFGTVSVSRRDHGDRREWRLRRETWRQRQVVQAYSQAPQPHPGPGLCATSIHALICRTQSGWRPHGRRVKKILWVKKILPRVKKILLRVKKTSKPHEGELDKFVRCKQIHGADPSANFFWLVPHLCDYCQFPLTRANCLWLVPISFD